MPLARASMRWILVKARGASQPAFFGIVWKPATIFRISTPVVLLLACLLAADSAGHPSCCCHLLPFAGSNQYSPALQTLLLLLLLCRVVLARIKLLAKFGKSFAVITAERYFACPPAATSATDHPTILRVQKH